MKAIGFRERVKCREAIGEEKSKGIERRSVAIPS
jgi:hypothetical protein